MALKPGDVVRQGAGGRRTTLWNVPWSDGYRPAHRHAVGHISARECVLVVATYHAEALVVCPSGHAGWLCTDAVSCTGVQGTRSWR